MATLGAERMMVSCPVYFSKMKLNVLYLGSQLGFFFKERSNGETWINSRYLGEQECMGQCKGKDKESLTE